MRRRKGGREEEGKYQKQKEVKGKGKEEKDGRKRKGGEKCVTERK